MQNFFPEQTLVTPVGGLRLANRCRRREGTARQKPSVEIFMDYKLMKLPAWFTI